VNETIRSLKKERKRPLSEYSSLEVREADGRSQSHGDYYRTDIVVGYVGLEVLP